MPEDFSARLRYARQLRGFSQSSLAQAADLQPSAISHFETGGRNPSFENLKRLADALKISSDYLIGQSDEPALSNGVKSRLIQHVEMLSGEDLEMLEQMAQTMANRGKQTK
jgi:transcriptional regulator with XRE-family HTH domain